MTLKEEARMYAGTVPAFISAVAVVRGILIATRSWPA